MEEDRESTEGPEEKKQKLEEPEGQYANKKYSSVGKLLCLYCSCPEHLYCRFLSLAEDSVSPPSSESGNSDDVELQIRPHPQHSELDEMAIRNLATSPLCTVSHLLRFIKLNSGR